MNDLENNKLTDNEWGALQNIARAMGVPRARHNDLPWLSRNLSICFKDKTHPDLTRAMSIIRKGLRD